MQSVEERSYERRVGFVLGEAFDWAIIFYDLLLSLTLASEKTSAAKTTSLDTTMLEISLGTVAWMSVILFQAIVHFAIMPRRRQTLEMDASETVEITPELDESTLDSSMLSHPYSENSFDEEEFDVGLGGHMNEHPKQFIQLLDQTGSELIGVSVLQVTLK